MGSAVVDELLYVQRAVFYIGGEDCVAGLLQFVVDSHLDYVLQILKPLLNEVLANNGGVESENFLVVSYDVFDLCYCPHLALLVLLVESHVGNRVEDFVEVFCDGQRLGSLREELEENQVRDEVESRESLSLHFQVLFQLFLTSLEFVLKIGKDGLDHFVLTARLQVLGLHGFLHHRLGPGLVNLLEPLRLVDEDVGDVSFGKDSFQRSPKNLHLDPEIQRGLDVNKHFLYLLDLFFEGTNVSHGHQTGSRGDVVREFLADFLHESSVENHYLSFGTPLLENQLSGTPVKSDLVFRSLDFVLFLRRVNQVFKVLFVQHQVCLN